MNILSVDTGIKNFGVSVFHNSPRKILFVKTIRTNKIKEDKVSYSVAAKIDHISRELSDIIRDYHIQGITGELPHLGTKSAKAAGYLYGGMSIIVSLAAAKNIPTKWVSPRELKELFTGDPDADKKKIMQKVCTLYGWDMTSKDIRCRKTKKIIRKDTTYHVMGKEMGSTEFEHAADSIAAFIACIHKPRKMEKSWLT